MNLYYNEEVSAALAANKPVVALESTIISHGMPYPQNLETALAVEADVRAAGAVPRSGSGAKVSAGEPSRSPGIRKRPGGSVESDRSSSRQARR